MESIILKKLRVCLVGMGLLLCVGCQTTSPSAGYLELLEQQEQVPPAGTLGVGDQFELRVHDEEGLSGKYVISSNGTINLPWIDRVKVKGLTCTEVEQKVAKKLKRGYLKAPTVTCSIAEYKSKRVYIFGEVQEPGSYSYTTNITVVEAIGMVGGMTERAAPNSAKLKRKASGDKIVVEIPLGAIVEGRQPDFKLYPGDIVYVPKSAY